MRRKHENDSNGEPTSSTTKMPLYVFLILLLSVFSNVDATLNCAGCTPLDTLTFDKLIAAFDVALIKFDTAYPYGDKHDEFAKVAVDAADQKRLFVGEVGVKDYGEKDNEELAKRFNVEKDDFPAVFVFTEDQHYRFKAKEFTAENIKAFLRAKTGLYLPLAGCIEALDKLVLEELEKDEADFKGLLTKVEAFETEEKKKADVYVKVLKKVVADGEDFITKELTRTKKLLDEAKVTEDKKKQLKEKSNVLKTFQRSNKAKDEL